MPSFNVMTSVKTPCPNKVTLWGLGLQHMNPGGTTQLVRTPRPSAALPPAPVCLGSSPTARPGPVRRVRNRPTPDPPPTPPKWARLVLGKESPRMGEGGPRSALSLPVLCTPRSAHVVSLDPVERVLRLLRPRPAPSAPLLCRAPQRGAVQRGAAAPRSLARCSLPRPRGRGGALPPAGV